MNHDFLGERRHGISPWARRGLWAAVMVGILGPSLWILYNFLITQWVAPMLFPHQLPFMTNGLGPPPDHSAQINRLLAAIDKDMAGSGAYAVSVKNLLTGEVINKNEKTLFDAASTSKLIIAAYVYHQAASGWLSLGTKVTIKPSDLEPGTGIIFTAGGTYTLRSLVSAMLTHSDNAAANALVSRMGKSAINNYGQQLGLTSTDRLKGNDSTAEDLRHIAEQIFEGQVTSKALTAELLGYIQHTDFEDRLPVLLPAGVNVYHKIGNGNKGDIHDVGVVEYQGIQYSVAILTRGFASPAAAKKAIQQASLLIYKYETEDA